jgi:hypothetical protein
MKKSLIRLGAIATFMFLLLLPPAVGSAQQGMAPPVGPQLVREGDFAVMLLNALELGQVSDEVEAEARLGDVGIAPRNGWIADYPTTPDILGELQTSVADAAYYRRIRLSRDEALSRLARVAEDSGPAVITYGGEAPAAGGLASADCYPTPAEIASYYYDEGPPVYSYYTPPPDFYYLYAHVPYPFWCRGLWFPGFFVLRDFHKVFLVDGRVVRCSNHFNDRRLHRVFRVDPVARVKGATYAGIGAPRGGRFINTGVARSDLTVFNAPTSRHGGVMTGPSMRGGMGARQQGSGPGMSSPSRGGPSSYGSAPRGAPSGGGSPGGGRR